MIRPSTAAAWMRMGMIALCALLVEPTLASSRIPADRGDSLGGFVLPVEARDGDVAMRAMRAWHWRVGTTQRLVLQGDCEVSIAGWVFAGQHMVFWIERIPSAGGLVTQVALWMPESMAPSASVGRGSTGQNLLVVATVRGETVLDVALMDEKAPANLDAMVQQADDRLAAYVQEVRQAPPTLATHPQVVEEPQPDDTFVPIPGAAIPTAIAGPGRRMDRSGWLTRPGATIAFSADTVNIDAGEDETRVLADGAVVVHYRPARRSDELGALRLSAERAVLFVKPGSMRELATDFDASDVRGIYLEGAVVAESDREDYVVRSPRMYYDFVTDRALMVDAVLRTYDRKRRVPIFARASELRQVAQNQWTGSQVRLSASSFAKPTLAIGSEDVTITRVPGGINADGTAVASKVEVEGVHNTLRAGGLPILWWPYFHGSADEMPLVSQSTSFENYQGVGLEARWDLYTLLGIEHDPGNQLILETAGYTKRGPAAGLAWDFDRPGDVGSLRMWGIHDSGSERLSTGITQEVPQTWRGELQWENTLTLGDDWLLQTQASYISDATFTNSWRSSEFRNRRLYESSVYLKQDTEQTALSAYAGYALNDFISNAWLLASQTFQLQEFPRVSYGRYGTDLFDTVTWSGEINVSRFNGRLPQGTIIESGITRQAFAGPNLIGLTDNSNLSDVAQANGIADKWLTRVETSHHFTMPLEAGPVNITPFASAQVQGFFTKEQTTTEDSNYRGIGGVGVHATTTFQRVYNGVHSDTLGLHRLRVLVEPYARAWYSAANFDPLATPDYDPLVDATSKGGAVQVGVRNRLQTQRGGDGQWYDEDWLTFDVSGTFSTSNATRRWYTPRWYTSNPLWSSWGNFVDGSFDMRPTEAIGLIGSGNWDLDLGQFTRASVGLSFDHSPRLSSSITYRYFQVPDDWASWAGDAWTDQARGQLLGFPVSYQISKLYSISVSPQYNFSLRDFQSVSANITRRLPDFDLVFSIRYDEIRGETIVAMSLGNTKF